MASSEPIETRSSRSSCSLNGVASTRNPGLAKRLRNTVPVSGASSTACL